MTFDQLIKNAPQIILDKLEDLKTLRENPQWHPEDNSYEHIKIVTERALGTNDPDLFLTGYFMIFVNTILTISIQRLDFQLHLGMNLPLSG